MAELNYTILDVFTAERYSGNPAAVVLDADGLSDEQMGRIAREFNLSETTFVTRGAPGQSAVSIRWFTPETEVDMCGHGTLAAVHALVESGRYIALPDEPGTILPITTRSGVLTVRAERLRRGAASPFLVWLDLPRPQLRPRPAARKLWAAALGIPADAFDPDLPSVQTQDGDMLVFVNSLPALMEARPDFKELAKLSRPQGVRGWCVVTKATLTPSIDVQSRFFAPAVGVDEDPVTGSVHGPLAAYLVQSGSVPLFNNQAALSCIQSDRRARSGLVRAVVTKDAGDVFDVRIGGECVPVMHGRLLSPS